MKQKRVNLKSTLNQKVALDNNVKNIESINQEIVNIHSKKEDVVRTTIHLPTNIHTKIKLYCVANGISFKEFVTSCLLSNKEVFKSN